MIDRIKIRDSSIVTSTTCFDDDENGDNTFGNERTIFLSKRDVDCRLRN